MTQKALVGVSSCLLGEEVRYNGLHKLDSFVAGGLAELVELRPVCPEVDIGLGVPRDPIQLARTEAGTRLVVVDSGTDCILWRTGSYLWKGAVRRCCEDSDWSHR